MWDIRCEISNFEFLTLCSMLYALCLLKILYKQPDPDGGAVPAEFHPDTP